MPDARTGTPFELFLGVLPARQWRVFQTPSGPRLIIASPGITIDLRLEVTQERRLDEHEPLTVTIAGILKPGA